MSAGVQQPDPAPFPPPAMIILFRQQPHERRIVHAAVTRHGKDSIQYRVQETDFAIFDIRQHVSTSARTSLQ